jgi:hypothetical protein
MLKTLAFRTRAVQFPQGQRVSEEIGGLKFELGGWYPNK